MFKQELFFILVLISLILICVNGTEYFIGSNMGTYDDGINICLNDGGILATITNQNDYNIARELCMNNNTQCWIGLNDLYSVNYWMSEYWTFIDGTSIKGIYGFDTNNKPTVGVGPWHDNEPNNGNNEHCVRYWNNSINFKWIDAPCNDITYPLCMRIETQPIVKQLVCIYYVHYM